MKQINIKKVWEYGVIGKTRKELLFNCIDALHGDEIITDEEHQTLRNKIEVVVE